MAFEQKGRRWLGRKAPGGDEGTSVKEHTTQTLRQGGVRGAPSELPNDPVDAQSPPRSGLESPQTPVSAHLSCPPGHRGPEEDCLRWERFAGPLAHVVTAHRGVLDPIPPLRWPGKSGPQI